MSFILDALKKSESDRQRQSGPALFEVKIAPPRPRFPLWAIALIVLLVVNSLIVGWVLLRRGSRNEESATATPPSVTGPANAAAAPAPSAAATAPVAATPSGATPTVTTAPAATAPPAPTSAPASPAPDARDSNEPTLAGDTRLTGGSEPSSTNPDDYAPATDAGPPMFKGHVKRGTESGYMLYQDAALVAGSNLPQLRLDLHVYAAKPQDRFALINMRKMHEGDTTPEGVRVENITPDGVVMSHNGQKFLLPRD